MTTYSRSRAVSVIKANGLSNAGDIFDAALAEGLALPAACALMEKESWGRNIYGHDAGGALSGFPGIVDASNFAVFLWLVKGGQNSNGVGPCQLTYPGFFDQMAADGLRPWVPLENMRYGFRLLEGYYSAARKAGVARPWVEAGTKYNGAAAYGLDLAAKVAHWDSLLAGAVA